MRRIDIGAVLVGVGLMVGCQLLVDGDQAKLSKRAEVEAACKDVHCKPEEHCDLVQVVCVTEPCEAVAECVPDNLAIEPFESEVGDERAEADGTSCGKNTCSGGQVCCNASCGICTEPGGACIQRVCDEEPPPDAEVTPPSSCAVVLCAPGTYCDDLGGEAKCLPLPSCKGVSCEEGTHCELEAVTCVRAPCPPQPTCVPDAVDPCASKKCPKDSPCSVVGGIAICSPDVCENPCIAVKCAKGTHCEAQEVQCVTEPCCAVAACVADEAPTTCGENTCGPGTYCCNASCGICAPKGGACTLQICDVKR